MPSQGFLFDLDNCHYQNVWRLQRELVEKRTAGLIPDVLIMVEHEAVITLGRRGSWNNVHSHDLPIYKIERGGDVTYHGPGQIVAYPIIKLDERNLSIHDYLRLLEKVLIRTLNQFGVIGEATGHQTGVWVENMKIASIGVAISRWVTYHGFALNVNMDLKEFARINPCGLQPDSMISLRHLLNRDIELSAIRKIIVHEFEKAFQIHLESKDLTTINQASLGSQESLKDSLAEGWCRSTENTFSRIVETES